MKTGIDQDKKTIALMVKVYCRHHLKAKNIPDDYLELIDYATKRLDKCKFGAGKPACKDCPVHCYKPEMRRRISEVMRWSGPRMILFAPFAAFKHLYQSLFVRVHRK